MIAVSRAFEEWQDAVKARLLGDEWLADVAILAEQLSSTTDGEGAVTTVDDIETRVLNALTTLNERASTIGACIVVAMPELDNLNPNVAGVFGRLMLRARVIVNPLFNNGATGTQKSEGQIALRAAHLLHQFALFTSDTLLSAAAAGVLAIEAIKPINSELPEGNNGYEITLFAKTGSPAPAKVALCTATVAAGECTITCGTAGAAIRYTINGGAPSAGNPDASTYTAPFAVAAGDIIRAAATKTELLESDTRTITAT